MAAGRPRREVKDADRWAPALARWHHWTQRTADSPRRALLVLLALNLIVTVPLLVSSVLGTGYLDRSEDMVWWADRAGTVARGGWLYEDTEHTTLTPPLINLLLVPPYLAGDAPLTYATYFSLFGFIIGALLYLGLRPWSTQGAFLVGALYVVSPFTYLTSTVMMQDDAIIPLFVALAYTALLVHGPAHSALWIGLGTMVKAFPAITAPVVFFGARDTRTRIKVAAYGFGTALLVALPFLIAVPRGFWDFLRFYATGESPEGGRFVSDSWLRLLHDLGTGWSPQYNILVLLLAFLVLWWQVARGRLSALQGFPIAFLLLFILYPKIHYGYYLTLLVALQPWALRSGRRVLGLFVAAGVARAVHLFRVEPPAYPVLFDALALVLAFGLVGYWVWWIRLLADEDAPSVFGNVPATAAPDDVEGLHAVESDGSNEPQNHAGVAGSLPLDGATPRDVAFVFVAVAGSILYALGLAAFRAF